MSRRTTLPPKGTLLHGRVSVPKSIPTMLNEIFEPFANFALKNAFGSPLLTLRHPLRPLRSASIQNSPVALLKEKPGPQSQARFEMTN